jgi:chaperonin cofactor prefoldin
MQKQPTDPLRAQLHERIQDLEARLAQLRDFATTPGNSWLAKGELQAIMNKLSDLETLLEDIKQADLESGY